MGTKPREKRISRNNRKRRTINNRIGRIRFR